MIRRVPTWHSVWMSWLPRGMARSSEAGSAFTSRTNYWRAFKNINFPKRRSGGMWISGGTDPSPTPASGWESNGLSPGSVVWTTSGKPFRSHVCCTNSTRRQDAEKGNGVAGMLRLFADPVYKSGRVVARPPHVLARRAHRKEGRDGRSGPYERPPRTHQCI